MSYIEKEKLIEADIASIENRVRHAFNQGYDLGYKEGRNKQPNCSEIPTGSTTKNDLGVDCIVDVLGSYTDLDIPYKREIAENILTKLSSVTPQEPRWISVGERLPEPNANDGLIARYYLIQNEYEDMLVARYDGIGWEQMYQHEYLEDDVIAWMPLPAPYEPQESEDEK